MVEGDGILFAKKLAINIGVKKIIGIDKNHIDLNEKGINTLYLAFGFIEWYESPNSDQKMLSPILLLPVNLEERKKTKLLLNYL